MRTAILLALGSAVAVQATKLLDRNLAYRSPFIGYDEVCIRSRAAFLTHIADCDVLVFSQHAGN